MLIHVASTAEVRQPARLRRWLLVLVVPLLAVSVLVLWAGYQGYVAVDRGCDDQGYGDPPPSFEVLVNDYGLSRYCARYARDEEWM
jgi:hypothetical protein